MPKQRSWSDEQLREAVAQGRSVRMVLHQLGLVPAGGNYAQIQQRIAALKLETSHFVGKAWNKGWVYDPRRKPQSLEKLLIKDSRMQSFKLKQRLYAESLKQPKCELCGWAEHTPDGRIPVELDHRNGDSSDNRLENLQILCPNCHSLQPTHRGKNKKRRYIRAGVGTGRQV